MHIRSLGPSLLAFFLLPGCSEKVPVGALNQQQGHRSSDSGPATGGDAAGAAPPGAGGRTVSANGGGSAIGGMDNASAGGSSSNAGTTGSGGSSNASGGASSHAEYLSEDGTYFVSPPPTEQPVGPDAPDAERCINWVAHGAQTLPDASAFAEHVGEFYHAFAYASPDGDPTYALSVKPIVTDVPGDVATMRLYAFGDAAVAGTSQDTNSTYPNSEILAQWGPGGNLPRMPAGVGQRLPLAGNGIRLDVHYKNDTAVVRTDQSGFRVCVTTKAPDHAAGLNWLGTEVFEIPGNASGVASGLCMPLPALTEDTHILSVTPSMRALGSHFSMKIQRGNLAQTDMVIDGPFDVQHQRTYSVDAVVHPGDTVSTECTWHNTTPALVPFSFLSNGEKCDATVLAYPNALSGTPSFFGATNSCFTGFTVPDAAAP
jgi:hypothetical protein